MQVTIEFEGKRGHRCGGVLFELQHRTPRSNNWHAVGQAREDSDTIPARLLGGWLSAPMPKKEVVA